MSKMQKLIPLVLFANVAAIASGCGQAQLPTQMGAERHAASVPTIMANGRAYKLGFDDKRYKQIDKKIKKTRMPRQGLLPTRMDNREFCSPVADQGKLGACTAFAVGKGFREFQVNKLGERKAPLSAMFLYYESRARWGTVMSDSGSTISDSMAVLGQKGIAPEQSWPYDVLKFTVEPTKDAYEAAKEYRFAETIRLTSLEDVKVALSKGEAVPFAFDVMESFRVGSDGMMPIPKRGEKKRGGHAVMAVGYDNQKQLVTVRNSWGADWGDQGYFYMPYEVFESNARDIWTTDFRR